MNHMESYRGTLWKKVPAMTKCLIMSLATKLAGKDVQEGEAPNAQKLWSPLFFTAAIGMALFWSCFFTMLMRNSFMDGDIDQLWYHLYLRMVFFLGAGAVCLVAAKASDFAASERGHRILTGGVCLFSVVAAVSSFTAFSFGLTMPLAFDLVAWSLAGAGLACLLLLWMEVVASFGRPFLPCCLAVSAALGGMAYLVLDLLPFPFNIGLLCVSPLLSLGVIKMVEQDASVVPAAFVPLAESRKRARLAPAYLAISAAYGIVFGLGIGSTTQIPGEEALYAGVAVFLLFGLRHGLRVPHAVREPCAADRFAAHHVPRAHHRAHPHVVFARAGVHGLQPAAAFVLRVLRDRGTRTPRYPLPGNAARRQCIWWPPARPCCTWDFCWDTPSGFWPACRAW